MNNYINHFKTICKHKYYVAQELFKLGYFWQGIIHDFSKFSPTEFFVSAKYFSGTVSPIEKEKAKHGYSLAWLNHKGKNKHHWQYWIDYNDGELVLCNIPDKYLVEMAADLVGASKAYLKGEYNHKEPLEYFKKNSPNWLMNDYDKDRVEFFIRLITKYF